MLEAFILIILLSLSGCGQQSKNADVRSGMVIKGQAVLQSEHPWQVLLVSGNSSEFCGGVIISSRHILTAAHCVYKQKRLMAYSGEGLLTIGRAKVAESARVFIHPSFDWDEDISDIAIIETRYDMVFSESVAPISIAGSDFNLENPDLLFESSGWGKTSRGLWSFRLQKIKMQLMPSISNKEYWVKMRGARFYEGYEKYQDDSLILTYPILTGSGLCFGDSGGPLVATDLKTKLQTLVGISTFIDGFCGTGLNLFSSIPHHDEWINLILSRPTISYR